MGYVFDWNTEKAQSNVRKHGVSFDEASTVFGDSFAFLIMDPDHSLEEERYLLLGNVDPSKVTGSGIRGKIVANTDHLSETSNPY